MDPKHTADTSASDIHAKHTPTSAAASADTAESTAPAATPDMHSVVEQLPMPRALKDWLVCLRKPAISLQYRISKRHIPDLDSEPQAGVAASATPALSSVPAADSAATDPSAVKASAASGSTEDTATPATPPAAKGKNTDLMTLSGGLTIRYFDLGMGLVGLLLAGCLFRGGCRVRKMLK